MLLINSPNRTSEPPRHYPYGPALLSAVVQTAGHEIEAFDGNFETIESLKAHLKKNTYDVIGLSGLVTTYRFQHRAAEAIKDITPNTPVIAGGGLASAVEAELLEIIPEIDLLFIGEAEESLPAFLESGDPTIEGIISRERPFSTIPQIGDLAQLPMPNLGDWKIERYFDQGSFPLSPNVNAAQRRANVLSSRGCAFHCDFCFNTAGRSRIRYRPIEQVVEEIGQLIDQYAIDFISFLDESFLTKKSRALELSEAFRRQGWSFRWGVAARSTSVDPEVLGAIAAAGCDYIYFGFDSGNPDTLLQMRKKMTTEGNIEAFMMTIDAGIYPVPNIIIGYDNETLADIRQNYVFFEQLVDRGRQLVDSRARHVFERGFNNFGAIYFATPYPGSDLYKRKKDSLPPLREMLQRFSGKDAYELTVNVSEIPDEVLIQEQKKMEMYVRGFRL